MRTTFRMEDEYITMIRGDTLSFNIELFDENEQPFTSKLDSVYFSCKHNKSDDVMVFQKSLNNGVAKISDNIYGVRVAPEDTRNIEDGKYYYDLEIGVNTDIFTVLHGVLEVEQDVTNGERTITPPKEVAKVENNTLIFLPLQGYVSNDNLIIGG